ncbi:MAG: sulfatase [Planctomycetota bacterium]|jgi:iduronate 2-sulfatase
MHDTLISTGSKDAGRRLFTVHFLILFSSFLLISCPQRAYSVDLGIGLDRSHIETSGATAEISNDKLLIRTERVSRPKIVISAPAGKWDLQASRKISMSVRNTGASTIRLSCILGDHKWNEGMIILHPGERDTMEVLIKGLALEDEHPLKANFENMNGAPGGYLHHWVKFEADSLSKLTFSVLNNKSESRFEIGDIRAEGNINELSNEQVRAKYFPLVDFRGQYKHAEWPGKIHSRKDLERTIELERKDLRQHPGPAGWDKYGGWLNGPQLEATGHFRAAKWNGKWWLVDPEGRLFWSHGPTCVNRVGAVTRIKGREDYFEGLPGRKSAFAQYFTPSGTRQRFNFTEANLHRKYGPDWKTVDFKRTAERLRSWGLNTAANWSDPDLYLNNKIPYTVAIGFGWPKLGGKGKKFPDVFDPAFRKGLAERLKKEVDTTTTTDPYCIGYFVDNELHWNGLAWTALYAAPDQHAKQAIVKHLKDKYGTVEKLNSAWKSRFGDWSDMDSVSSLRFNDRIKSDLDEFDRVIAGTYYSICRSCVKAVAPDKLYLGSRLTFHYYPDDPAGEWVIRIAAKHCDVIGFNRYRYSVADFKLPDDIDRPVIIGEFHFGALDRGQLHTGLRSVVNQRQRARAYEYYVLDALNHPNIVGAHWFQFRDQAVTGRGDGENYQIGLLDVCDTPYWETVDACREVGYRMYDIRSGRKNQKPNVLLIMCDDLNDYSGAFGGHHQVRTPNIDKLAQSGVVFANAQSNCPVCSPSRNSLFTGVYTHRSRDFGWTPYFKQPVLKNCKTLMEYFRENGYLVVGSGKLLHNNRKDLWDDWGVEINNYGPFAFDGNDLVGHPSVPEPFRSIGPVDGSFAPLSDVPRFPNSAGPGRPGWIYSWDKKKYLNYIDENSRDLTPDEMHAEWAVRKIKELENRREQRPFFMGVGFVRPHTPLHAPKRFFDMFPIDKIELSLLKEGDAEDCYYTNVYPLTRKGPRYYRLLKESYPDIEIGLKHFLQAYLACIAFVDEQIGAVIDALNSSRFRDNTVIVFTSDHGWNMGEKEYLFKNSPWEESARVPLIIRAPGTSKAGSSVDHPVSLIDIYPTLADLCQLEGSTMKNASGAPIDGYSLMPFLKDPQSQDWEGPDGALTVLGVGVNNEDVLEQNYSYRTSRWRYIRYRNGQEELYNHRNDPYEWDNLAADEKYAAKKRELKDQMMAIVRKGLEEGQP